MKKLLLSAVAAVAISTSQADAAFITFDDSNPDTITVTAGDFEGGFSVDGTLLTTGLGASASITLPDGAHNFSGTWIDDGLSSGLGALLQFALPSAPSVVTSFLTFGTTSSGGLGTIVGDFAGFTGGSYGSALGTTLPQDGHTEFPGVPFLSIAFITEAVPVPASLALLGAGLAGLGLLRRRN